MWLFLTRRLRMWLILTVLVPLASGVLRRAGTFVHQHGGPAALGNGLIKVGAMGDQARRRLGGGGRRRR